MFRKIFIAALLGASTAAACPVAEDLDTSISIIFDDGITEVYRRSGTDVVAVEGRIDGVVGYRMQLAHGIHLLRYEDVENGRPVPSSLMVYDYGMAPADLPLPDPGGRGQADVIVTRDGEAVEEDQSLVYGERGSLEIGDCVYESLPVTIAYDTPGGYIEGLIYLPELEFAILDWTQTGAEDRIEIAPLEIARGK